MNNTIDTIMNRTSLRSFDDRAIDRQTKELLFRCGMQAPTAGNQMLYTMIDVTDQSKKDRLAVLCDNQPFISRAPMVVVYLADHHKWFQYYSHNDMAGYCDKVEGMVYEAPQESDLFLACEDAMCAAQNMVIGAESLGIGSCYIGDILENYEEIVKLFDLPEWAFPIGMLVFGYRKENSKRASTKRFAMEYVVNENAYRHLKPDEIDAMYDTKDARYNPNNKVGADNFAQQFYHRKTGAAFSKEMARSVGVAIKKWDGRKL